MLRNRTLTGCGTCRSRHVNCDETHPVCQNCQQQNLACLGYERQLNWAKESQQDADRVFRRPLFSVTDQQRMTRMTTDSLGQQSASAALAKLDFESGSGREAGLCSEDSFQGPFGVLKVLPSQASPDNQTEPQPAEPTRLELDLLWDSLDMASTTAGDTQLFNGMYDPEVAGDAPPDPLWEVDTIPNDLQILHPPSLTPSLALPKSKRIPPLAPDLLRYLRRTSCLSRSL